AETLAKALTIDSRFLPAKANTGSLALVKKDYPAARRILTQVYDGGMRSGEILLQLVAAQIYSAKQGLDKIADKNGLAAAVTAVENYLRGEVDFQQELVLSEVYLNFLRNEL